MARIKSLCTSCYNKDQRMKGIAKSMNPLMEIPIIQALLDHREMMIKRLM